MSAVISRAEYDTAVSGLGNDATAVRALADQRIQTLEAALTDAKGVLETARQYFPKSIRNGDRFHLENVLENAVNKALR